MLFQRLRTMPWGIALFLVYALLILAGIGIAMPFVINLAIGAPVTLEGVVLMVLLAYTIFTTTLVIQRKEASRTLALWLATLTIPPIPFLLLSPVPGAAFLLAAFALLLFRGLAGREVRSYLIER